MARGAQLNRPRLAGPAREGGTARTQQHHSKAGTRSYERTRASSAQAPAATYHHAPQARLLREGSCMRPAAPAPCPRWHTRCSSGSARSRPLAGPAAGPTSACPWYCCPGAAQPWPQSRCCVGAQSRQHIWHHEQPRAELCYAVGWGCLGRQGAMSAHLVALARSRHEARRAPALRTASGTGAAGGPHRAVQRLCTGNEAVAVAHFIG